MSNFDGTGGVVEFKVAGGMGSKGVDLLLGVGLEIIADWREKEEVVDRVPDSALKSAPG